MMNKLKTWFYVFKRSLTDPSYYKELEKTKLSFSLKYLYLLLIFVFLITGVQFAILAFAVLPTLPSKINEYKQSLIKDYPEGLEIKINNGELSTNQKEPFYVNFPQTRKLMNFKEKTNLITIDTKGDINEYPTYNTFILVGKKYIVAPDDNNSYKLYPLDSEGQTVINKAAYLNFFTKADPFIQALPNIIFAMSLAAFTIFPFFAAGFSLLGKLSYLLILTLFLLLIAALMKKKYKFSTLYRLGIHGLTLPILVGSLLGLFGIFIPWLYTLLFLVWMGVVLNKLK